MSKFKLSICYLLATLPYISSFAQQVSTSNKVKAKLDSTFREAQSAFELPGFAIGIIKGNKIVYEQGFGKTELTSQGKNVTASSLFIWHLFQNLLLQWPSCNL
jgi:CubicO group peptidase (beta-lactamase class C family)